MTSSVALRSSAMHWSSLLVTLVITTSQTSICPKKSLENLSLDFPNSSCYFYLMDLVLRLGLRLKLTLTWYLVPWDQGSQVWVLVS